MQTLLGIMRQLRAPDGCPWDREQTHESLRPYLLEEAAEAVDAVQAGDPEALADELGDVLLQVAFHAVIAEEAGTFAYENVEKNIVDKLLRRHPHVFGDVAVANAEEVITNWQAIKAQEKGDTKPSAADSVPQSLPALMRAGELSKKLGWATPDLKSVAKQTETLEPTAESIGALLMAIASYARAHNVNPELALRDTLGERVKNQ